ncbi:caspase family protein [Actinoplanes sp. NPDC049681]|uniref:caspase, EACC1-associated type n=1 Tax=Actinoplanes sp. NPDC049681 TaxID=3363905 RepID=UPI0037BE03A8
MNGTPARRALLLGCTTFADPTLASLRSPRRDVRELERVLGSPGSCGYQVSTELDCPSRTAQRAIEGFLAQARTTDAINVLYLSCHGVQDDRGKLYFAFADTEKEYLSSTAVSADWVRDRVTASRSKATLMLIDCCFSGAFIDGMRARSGTSANVESLVSGPSEGRGLAVLTASGETEVSFEDAESADVRPSYFTEALVSGLSSGAADLNRDGRITVDELYEYVYDRVVSGPSPQRPRRLGVGEGALVVAEAAARPSPPPAPSRVDGVVRAEGVQGYAAFDGQWIVIGKEGVGPAVNGERRFPVSRLIGIAGRPATRLHHGFFQLLLEGVEPAPLAPLGPDAGRPPMDDFASLSYPYGANADFERLGVAVQAAVDVAKGLRQPVPDPSRVKATAKVGHSAAAPRPAPPGEAVDADTRKGERDGAEAMARLPLAVVDGLVACGFDVVRWLVPWRHQWASTGQPAPWLPALARCLGGYAAPWGYPPSPAYLAGFCEGMRRAWYGAAHSGLLQDPGSRAGGTIADLRAARGRNNRRTVAGWVGRPLLWASIVVLAVFEAAALATTIKGQLTDANGEPYANPAAAAIGLNACFLVPLAALVIVAIRGIRRRRRERRGPR